jgi:hypothetical protein
MFAQVAPGAVPCGNQHRCCVSEDRDLPATITPQSETSRTEGGAGMTAISFDASSVTANSGNDLAGAHALRPYTTFSTILRI